MTAPPTTSIPPITYPRKHLQTHLFYQNANIHANLLNAIIGESHGNFSGDDSAAENATDITKTLFSLIHANQDPPLASQSLQNQIFWCDLFRHDASLRLKDQEGTTPNDPVTHVASYQSLLNASQWNGAIVALLSYNQKSNPSTQSSSLLQNEILASQLQYCHHLGIKVVAFREYLSEIPNLAEFAQCIKQNASRMKFTYFWFRVRLGDEDDADWNAWNQLRCLCGVNSHVVQSQFGLVLEFGENVETASDGLIQRWLAEPVQAISLDMDAFGTQSGGIPDLSKRHTAALLQFAQHEDVAVVLRSTVGEENSTQQDLNAILDDAVSFLQSSPSYLASIVQEYSTLPPLSEIDYQINSFANVLQRPLQPLQDNLESQTYETFEKDPIKYKLYEQAIEKAFCACLRRRNVQPKELLSEDSHETDMFAESSSETLASSNDNTSDPIVLMVLGAGRGPLVRASVSAVNRVCPSRQAVKFFVVEKNTHCLHLLRGMKHSIWSDLDMEIVHGDMRMWKAPHPADIMVSELLGSFGDNELSPECLYAAQRFLADDGICIPQKYTSYVAPISSTHLSTSVGQLRKEMGESAYEMGYVVNAQKYYEVAAPQKVFNFQHPAKNSFEGDSSTPIGIPSNNNRHRKLHFESQESCLLTGLIGYFECQLHDDVLMSILPETYSSSMFSWFPIYFPIKNSISLVPEEQVCIHFWRCSDDVKVWYEWSVCSETQQSEVHNCNGESYYMLK